MLEPTFQKHLAGPPPDDESPIQADRIFIKHGNAPPFETMDCLSSLQMGHVSECGHQVETRCLAAGCALLDAGLQPTLTDLTAGHRWIAGRERVCGGGSIIAGTR